MSLVFRSSGGGSADFSDLVGDRAAGVHSDLERQGFRSVDRFQSGSKGSGTIWWNGRTRQCLQMITVDGRAAAEQSAVSVAACGGGT